MKPFLTILAFLAFLNPLCCCSASWLLADAGRMEATVPGCCSSPSPTKSPEAPASPDHDPAKCPHRANASFHEEGTLEIGAQTLDLVRVPRLISILDLQSWKNPLSGEPRLFQEFGRAPPPRLHRQVYCVYLI